jgi:hypothetical protein
LPALAPSHTRQSQFASSYPAALRDPTLRGQISALDYEIRDGTPTEFAAFMTLDISRYTRLAQEMGLGED